MSFFDDLMGELSYTEDAVHPHFAQALQGMLGGDDEEGLGLDGLLQRLQAAGLGGIVESWLGGGTNMPIAPDQLRAAIGDDEAAAMAARVGMSEELFLGALAEHLPGLVDHLTSNGRLLPAGASGTSVV